MYAIRSYYAGNASSEVKKTLKQLDVDNAKIKRIVVALFEAEINVVAHADSGIITVTIDDEKVEMIVDDKGPGIYDITKAMQEGYSTATRQVSRITSYNVCYTKLLRVSICGTRKADQTCHATELRACSRRRTQE